MRVFLMLATEWEEDWMESFSLLLQILTEQNVLLFTLFNGLL